MVVDRFSDFKLGMASQLNWETIGVARAASSCNALAIATFSSSFLSIQCAQQPAQWMAIMRISEVQS